MEKLWESIVRKWKDHGLTDKLKRQLLTLHGRIKSNRKLQIGLVIAALPLLLILIVFTIVLIDTPSKKVLRSTRNPIASEVYTADSVLIGRYFVQDRTSV